MHESSCDHEPPNPPSAPGFGSGGGGWGNESCEVKSRLCVVQLGLLQNGAFLLMGNHWASKRLSGGENGRVKSQLAHRASLASLFALLQVLFVRISCTWRREGEQQGVGT